MNTTTWRRPTAITAIAVVAAIAVVVALVMLRTGGPASDPVVRVLPPAGDAVVLVAVPGGVAAVSLDHGPREHQDGRAAGFSYDQLGAAVAASNLVPRVSVAAGPAVSEATLAGQCFGDLATALQQLRSALPLPDDGGPAADLVPRALWFRIIGGDPASDMVVVSLLADTAQSRTAGGFSRVDAVLRWHDRDWQLRVPVAPPAVQPGRDGYTLLAGTP